MRIRVAPHLPPTNSTETVWLVHNTHWNDWWEYKLTYNVTYENANNERFTLGESRFAYSGLKGKLTDDDKYTVPLENGVYDKLEDGVVSLGTGRDYYAKLESLGTNVAVEISSLLNDGVQDIGKLLRLRAEPFFSRSLMRGANIQVVEGEYRRALYGLPAPSYYNLVYRDSEIAMDFVVDPASYLPDNLHVIIGTNGVGKTTLLKKFTRLMVSTERDSPKNKAFETDCDDLEAIIEGPGDSRLFTSEHEALEVTDEEGSTEAAQIIFEGIHFISWSAFDLFEEADAWGSVKRLQFSRIGPDGIKRLGHLESTRQLEAISPDVETSNIEKSFLYVLNTIRERKQENEWLTVLASLESDPVFKRLNVYASCNKGETEALQFFKALSDGHKVVLLTVSYLSATLQEKALVLLDEPEAHLHPPLLSALIRCLRNILRRKNAVGIISTHSPVVLQEITSDCVWIIDRSDDIVDVRRPAIETYGEDVGELTHQVFGLQVRESGFYDEMRTLADSVDSFESALEKINKNIGSVGKSILRTFFAEKQQEMAKQDD